MFRPVIAGTCRLVKSCSNVFKEITMAKRTEARSIDGAYLAGLFLALVMGSAISLTVLLSMFF